LTINGKNRFKERGDSTSPPLVAGLGHRRLSIIDHSEQGFQPFVSHDKKKILICNGEIYNYKRLRRELSERGALFNSQSDSEVILHLYEEWGVDGFQKLVGMYAFVLLDLEKKRLILHRDR